VSPPLVLASGSTYRAAVLEGAGFEVTVDPPEVDERVADHLFAEVGAEGLALELARRKAAAVAPRHPGARVLAADQVGVLGTGADAVMLTKQDTPAGAVAQLLALSGTTHRLVNGLVVRGAPGEGSAEGVDVRVVTMRRIDEAEARSYVDAFRPFDTAGSYRLEDQDLPAFADAVGEPFVTVVEGGDHSGVLGMPLGLLRRLLTEVADATDVAGRP
jgi:septum formation protein